jgi:hypothetical protein
MQHLARRCLSSAGAAHARSLPPLVGAVDPVVATNQEEGKRFTVERLVSDADRVSASGARQVEARQVAVEAVNRNTPNIGDTTKFQNLRSAETSGTAVLESLQKHQEQNQKHSSAAVTRIVSEELRTSDTVGSNVTRVSEFAGQKINPSFQKYTPNRNQSNNQSSNKVVRIGLNEGSNHNDNNQQRVHPKIERQSIPIEDSVNRKGRPTQYDHTGGNSTNITPDRTAGEWQKILGRSTVGGSGGGEINAGSDAVKSTDNGIAGDTRSKFDTMNVAKPKDQLKDPVFSAEDTVILKIRGAGASSGGSAMSRNDFRHTDDVASILSRRLEKRLPTLISTVGVPGMANVVTVFQRANKLLYNRRIPIELTAKSDRKRLAQYLLRKNANSNADSNRQNEVRLAAYERLNEGGRHPDALLTIDEDLGIPGLEIGMCLTSIVEPDDNLSREERAARRESGEKIVVDRRAEILNFLEASLENYDDGHADAGDSSSSSSSRSCFDRFHRFLFLPAKRDAVGLIPYWFDATAESGATYAGQVNNNNTMKTMRFEPVIIFDYYETKINAHAAKTDRTPSLGVRYEPLYPPTARRTEETAKDWAKAGEGEAKGSIERASEAWMRQWRKWATGKTNNGSFFLATEATRPVVSVRGGLLRRRGLRRRY